MKQLSNLAMIIKSVLSGLCIFCLVGASVNAQKTSNLEQARRLCAEGDQLHNQANYAGALQKYDQAIRLAPNYADSYFLMGRACYKLNDYPAALTAARKATQLQPNDHRYQGLLGDIYLFGQTTRDYRKASEAYRQALRIDSGNSYYWAALGDSYFNLSEWQNAIDSYQKSVEIRPDQAAVHYYKGQAHFKLRQFTEFKQAFQQVLKSEPKSKNDLSSIARVHSFSGQLNEAVRFSSKAIAFRNDDNDAGEYISLSWYYSFLEDHVKAHAAATKAIELDPKSHMGYTNKCRALDDLGLYEQAVSTCQQALQLKPEDGETLFYLGQTYRLKKNVRKATELNRRAINALDKTIKEDPLRTDSYDLLYLYGNALLADNKTRQAIENYEATLRVRPHFPQARKNLVIAYLRVNNKVAALKQYDELRQISTKKADELKPAMPVFVVLVGSEEPPYSGFQAKEETLPDH